MRFEDHPAEKWTPARHVPTGVYCDFCNCWIRKASPGNSTGSRGTKAWYNAYRKVWECLGCRTEAMRADFARAVEAAMKANQDRRTA